mgnify:CR=1 FL=1
MPDGSGFSVSPSGQLTVTVRTTLVGQVLLWAPSTRAEAANSRQTTAAPVQRAYLAAALGTAASTQTIDDSSRSIYALPHFPWKQAPQLPKTFQMPPNPRRA